jgi:hypothetical protein
MRLLRDKTRGWLPDKPSSPSSKLKSSYNSAVVAITATLLIVSFSLLSPGLFSSPASFSSSIQPAVFPAVASSAPSYGPASMGSSYYGDSMDEWAYSIKLTDDVGMIMAGYTKSIGAGGSDVWVIKTAPYTYNMGNITGSSQRPQWNVTFGGVGDEGAFSVIQTADFGYAVAGYTNSSGAGGFDMLLIKIDSDGVVQWNKTFGSEGDDAAKSLIQTSDGGYLLTGYKSLGSIRSAYIVKTDASGDLQWDKLLPGIAANSVVQLDDGGFVLAMEYSRFFGLTKVSSYGEILLERTFENSATRVSTQAIVQTDDGYCLAGWYSDNKSESQGGWLVKTNLLGVEQWNQTFPGYQLYALTSTYDGGFALTGDRAVLVITDSQGNELWNRLYDQQTGDGGEYFTRMQSIFEATPNHFVLAGGSDGGVYVHLQFNWIQLALKSGDQLIPPEVTIVSPQNVTYSQRDVPLTFTVNESPRFIAFAVNGQLNLTASGNITLRGLENGQYSLKMFVTDQDYNTASSSSISFTVNSTEPYVLPTVSILSPAEGIVNGTQVTIDFTIDRQVFWTAFSLDGSANKTALPHLVIPGLSEGNHSLIVYAGYLPNGMAGYSTVNFTVSLPHPTNITISFPPIDLNGTFPTVPPSNYSSSFPPSRSSTYWTSPTPESLTVSEAFPSAIAIFASSILFLNPLIFLLFILAAIFCVVLVFILSERKKTSPILRRT